jgi:hypothetical protein
VSVDPTELVDRAGAAAVGLAHLRGILSREDA